jgi:replicative DNA helicase
MTRDRESRGATPAEELRFATEDAEMALVGCLLQDWSAVEVAMAIVGPDDLLFPGCRDLYAVIVATLREHKTVDLLLVMDTAKRLGIGITAEEIQTALARAPFTPNVEKYAMLCLDYARRRKSIEEAGRLAIAAHDLSQPYDEVAAKVAWGLLQTTGAKAAEEQSAGDVARQVLTQYEQYHENPQPVRGVSTGMRSIDAMLGGLPTGLIVVGAGTHVGKTAWACALAQNVAANGQRVAYFTHEMRAKQLAGRLILSVARIDMMKAWKGECSAAEMETLTASAHIIGDLPLWWIDQTEANTVADIAARAYRDKARYGLDLIIVDSLGLYVPRSSDQRNLRIGEATLALLSIATTLDIPIVALHHVGRAAEQRADNRPQLSDYLWSSYVERDADIAAFLWREELNATKASGAANPAGRRMEFIVRKNRQSGRLGTALLYFGEFAEVHALETGQKGGPPRDDADDWNQEAIPL